MPRDIPVGNGQMLVCFDQHYQVRDLYYPHVGQENHVGGPCRFGVWALLPQTDATRDDRRKRRLFWTGQGWQARLGYQPDTLATDVHLRHDQLRLEMRCNDVVDFHRPVLVRRIEVRNLEPQPREVRLFHHNDLGLYGSRVGDTAYYDPVLRCLIHYRNLRYLMTTWFAEGEQRIDQLATGTAGFLNAEGTWRDAEDGELGGNAIAQGSVDSTMMLRLHLEAGGSAVAYLVIGAGQSYPDIKSLQRFLHREGPQSVIDRTVAYWRLWLAASRVEFNQDEQGAPPEKLVEMFQRSLLVLRTQIDNSGAIIAANDSDIMQFSRDTYSYLWPRDGALVAAALDDAGFPDVARSFYSLCSRIIDEQGYFLHKYNPDGSPASSWHPWVSLGSPQLPIQEDQTALVVWALWRHYLLYRDIEFVRPLWVHLITRAADFLVRFRDPQTRLPLPGYNLWEDTWGVHAFTVGAVYGGLQAAWQFAVCFGDTRRADAYARAAEEVRTAFGRHFWSQSHGRFLRRIVPLDHARTARLMAQVMAGRSPRPEGQPEYDPLGSISPAPRSPAPAEASSADNDASPDPAAIIPPSPPTASGLEFELDATVDSSLYGLFAFGMLPVTDPRVEKTMRAVEERLTIRTSVGGVARYENDSYHRASEARVAPGNPWFVCTLWLADWKIAKATTAAELAHALPILNWVADHALASGVLAEQVHPFTNAPLSVSPLTWSHAAFVSTMTAYQRKLRSTHVCPECGQPRGGASDATVHNHSTPGTTGA